jgi:hypothetical protein
VEPLECKPPGVLRFAEKLAAGWGKAQVLHAAQPSGLGTPAAAATEDALHRCWPQHALAAAEGWV